MLRLLQVHGFIEEPLAELLPGMGMGGNGGPEPLSHGLAEYLIAPGTTGTAQHRKFTGQAPLEEQGKHGRDQLAVRQIPGRTEDDQALGRDDPLLA